MEIAVPFTGIADIGTTPTINMTTGDVANLKVDGNNFGVGP